MGYSLNSLGTIREALPEKFDGEGGEALFRQLEDLEDLAIRECGSEMGRGSASIYGRFLESYNAVPSNAPLRTPQIGRGVDRGWLSRRDSGKVWGYLATESGMSDLSEIASSFEGLVGEIVEVNNRIVLKSGPVKRKDVIVKEIDYVTFGVERVVENDHRIRIIRDIIRGRIEAATLKDVEVALIAIFSSKLKEKVVSCFNTYDILFPTVRGTGSRPYLACNAAFSATKDMPYELQVMTSNAALVGKITHPLLESDRCIPVNVREDITTLAWAVHAMDYEKYLA